MNYMMECPNFKTLAIDPYLTINCLESLEPPQLAVLFSAGG